MMTLAMYEAFTPGDKRANLGDTIRRIEIEGKTMEDPLGNAMVDSTQQLSGLKKSKKKLKPKMPQSLSRAKTYRSRVRVEEENNAKRTCHPKQKSQKPENY